jgi:hypothetical protein
MDAQKALDLATLVPGWATLLVPGVLPILGRSKRALYVLAAIAAVIPVTWWIAAFYVDYYAPLVAFLTTVAWVLGLAIAFLQRLGMDRGWPWARFPFPALTGLLAIGGMTLFLNWYHAE